MFLVMVFFVLVVYIGFHAFIYKQSDCTQRPDREMDKPMTNTGIMANDACGRRVYIYTRLAISLSEETSDAELQTDIQSPIHSVVGIVEIAERLKPTTPAAGVIGGSNVCR
ncbi:Uncharacterized protein FWK35_00013355 [Aphis craccivora]|uniref:Uncharacterized protein n=1 Tax=Aphis craccivora TaxID=307492 RepID=A0A6G0ZC29_APHCR|nr:Uncharacterized protein FWK35_00013355 [Aphis craccivora]